MSRVLHRERLYARALLLRCRRRTETKGGLMGAQ